MQMNISQQMKMAQVMKMSPRMIQSMEILQLSALALDDRVEQEMQENPVLERDEAAKKESVSESEVQRNKEEARSEASERDPEQKELVSDKDNASDFERLDDISSSEEWPEDNLQAGPRISSNRVSDSIDRAHDMMSNITERPETLHDHLLEQFRFFGCDKVIKDFGEYLIQNLDHNGRLQSSLPEIVQVYGRAIEMEDAQEALRLVQKLEPRGVGARDVKECLLLQITPQTPMREVLINLVTSHLEDLSQNRLPAIQRKTGYSIELIKDALEELRHLEPYPGRGFEVAHIQTVTADMTVEPTEDGHYIVRLNDEYTPSLRISRQYQKMLKQGAADGDTKDFIRKKIESAKWLIESIEQRQNTLRKVGQAIVDHQEEFLREGDHAIAPLKMQQIADQVGVHVTTVSRAVDDKWIQTPRGLMPLKRFFGGGTTTDDGEEVAWDVVRNKLQEIIDEEDKSKPLSDDALVDELAKHGYTLARRTVTKYRKNMGIPSSRQRKEY